MGLGLVLAGSYLSVFAHITDVAGGTGWLVASVAAAALAATISSRYLAVSHAVALGLFLVLLGVGVYLALVPEIRSDLLTVAFARRWLNYLTGVSVLEFRRVDLWAVVVAPGFVYLSWLLLLVGRYDASALTGGVLLAFFTLTGDATSTASLVGWTSLLGTMGAGTVAREGGSLREVLQIGFVLMLALFVARQVDLVPDNALASTSSGGGTGGGAGGQDVEGGILADRERADIHGSISFQPTVLFSVEAAEATYRHVSAYDRYTGADWIRTGGDAPLSGALGSPPGGTRRLEQTVEVEGVVRTLPAAWKPVSVRGLADEELRVTDLGGLVPQSVLRPDEVFVVTSEVPIYSREQLRAAGTEYPPGIEARYTQLPGSLPDRVHRLAAELAGEAATPYDAAIAIRDWLRAEKSYALGVERPDGDVVDAFLFEMDAGYCVYYASAMAAMLRSVGVPARFALGYGPGQAVRGDRWVVRLFDSHAWVEVYFAGVGWVAFDPTPGQPRHAARQRILELGRETDLARADTLASRGRALRQSVLDPANGTVTTVENRTDAGEDPGNESGVDATSILPGEEESAGETTVAEDAMDRPIEDLSRWIAERDRLSVLASAACVAIGLHWVGLFERARTWARLNWQRPTDSPTADVVRAMERVELLLSQGSGERRPDETRRRFVSRVAGDQPDGAVMRVLDLYERAVFDAGVTRAEANEAIRLADQLVEGAGDAPLRNR